MKTPPLLVAAALLFWGSQTGFLVWAALMAILVEGSRLVKTRWEFSDTDLNRIWNLCAILFVGAAVVLYTSEQPASNNAFTFTQWQPFIFFPMALAQAFGTREKFSAKVFSWFLRRRKTSAVAEKGINISFLYFAVCLLGASATNSGGKIFYPIIAALISWALFSVRPRRVAPIFWALAMFAVVSGGYLGQERLRDLQSMAESALGNWLGFVFRRDANPREARTAIGQVGRLKLSGKILYRVESKSGPPPGLIREVTYDRYQNTVWWATAPQSEFTPAAVETNDTVQLLENKDPSYSASIAGYLNRGTGLLPLPNGTFHLDNLPVVLETNSLGVAKVKVGPGLVNYVAHFGPGKTFDGDVRPMDLDVPDRERPAIGAIVEFLDLNSKTKTTDEKIEAIQQFFRENFEYSMTFRPSQFERSENRSALTIFLTRTLSGHCEYFATATVLLLREAGIPARYATGYAVQEPAGNNKSYVVRERHGHAWTLVYRNGVWEDLDTTPGSWSNVEESNASMWEPVSDFLSWVGFQFSKWRWGKANYTRYLIWLLIPLSMFLVWRIVFNKERKRAAAGKNPRKYFWPGLDSEFYLVERKLAQIGFARAEHEPLALWQKRLQTAPVSSHDELNKLISLHQRYRFDPRGLNSEDREFLRKTVKILLAELKSIPAETK